MNYTNNYHLPQWEKSDRVLMDDFNQAMSNIESGIDSAAQKGTDAASSAGNTAAQAAAAAKNAAQSAAAAQATADTALAAAQAAQSTADNAFFPDKLPYKTGTYTGNGGTRTIELGFKPSFVIVTVQAVYSVTEYVNYTLLAGPGGNVDDLLSFTETGFTVRYANSYRLALNYSGTTYGYIAFR